MKTEKKNAEAAEQLLQVEDQLVPDSELGIITDTRFCQILGISPKTASRWRSHGVVPFVRIQKKVYYRIKDLERMIENYTYRNAPKIFGR